MPTAKSNRHVGQEDKARTIWRVKFPTVEARWRFEGLARKMGKRGPDLLAELALTYLEDAENEQQKELTEVVSSE